MIVAASTEAGSQASGLASSSMASAISTALNGKTVLSAEWGTAISKNPYLQFSLKGAKAGDKVGVRWLDNRGETRSDEATVA